MNGKVLGVLLAGMLLSGCMVNKITGVNQKKEIRRAQEAVAVLEEVSGKMHAYYHASARTLFETSSQHILELVDGELPGYSFSGSDAYNMDYIISLNMQTASGRLVGGTTATLWRRNLMSGGSAPGDELYTVGIQTMPHPHVVYKYCKPQSKVGEEVCKALEKQGFKTSD